MLDASILERIYPDFFVSIIEKYIQGISKPSFHSLPPQFFWPAFFERRLLQANEATMLGGFKNSPSPTGVDNISIVGHIADRERQVLLAYRNASIKARGKVEEILKIEDPDGEIDEEESISESPAMGKRKKVTANPTASKKIRTQDPSTYQAETHSDVPRFNFNSLANPRNPVPCMIQVDTNPTIGSLIANTEGLGFKFCIDGGLHSSPSISLLYHFGRTREHVGLNTWRVDDYACGQWVIRSMEITRPCESDDPGINNRDVKGLCNLRNLDWLSLYCASLDLTPFQYGFYIARKADQANTKLSPDEIETISSIWKGRRDYKLRMWFIQDAPDFRTNCLNQFMGLYAQRHVPLFSAVDQSRAFFLCRPNIVPQQSKYDVRLFASSDPAPQTTKTSQPAQAGNKSTFARGRKHRNVAVPSFYDLPIGTHASANDPVAGSTSSVIPLDTSTERQSKGIASLAEIPRPPLSMDTSMKGQSDETAAGAESTAPAITLDVPITDRSNPAALTDTQETVPSSPKKGLLTKLKTTDDFFAEGDGFWLSDDSD